MGKPKHLKIFYLFWLVTLSLNGLLVAYHTDHAHQICAHGEITHDDGEKSSETKAPSYAGLHSAHQHCVTSAWSRTAVRLDSPCSDSVPEIIISSHSLAPTFTAAFINIAVTLQAPKNSPPFV